MSRRPAPGPAEPRWPKITAAVAYVLGFPAVFLVAFVLTLAGAYGLGQALAGTAVGGFFSNHLPFFGIVGGLLISWGYSRAVRATASALARRLRRTGQAIAGTVKSTDDQYRYNPRGSDRRLITLTVWFPADPSDPREHSRELVALRRHFAFYARDQVDPDALLAAYPIGTPVTVHRSRRALVCTTDIDYTHRAWYEFW